VIEVPRDDNQVRLPFVLGPVTNGEFLPAAADPGDIWLAEELLARADTAAGRIGLDRRRFPRSAGGMAALLGPINVAGCTGTGRRLASPHRGGGYRVPAREHLPACEPVRSRADNNVLRRPAEVIA